MTPGLAALAGVVLAAAPAMRIEPGLEPRAAVEREARAAWDRLEAVWRAGAKGAAGPGSEAAPPVVEPGLLRVRRDPTLPPSQSGTSRLGYIGLRQDREGAVDERLVLALRHELAHQFLWTACPASARDALFHEAFALATSGELETWTEGSYLSLAKARETLERGASLDGRPGRRALARVLSEGRRPGEPLPPVLLGRVRRCLDQARWSAPLTLAELFDAGPPAEGDALVVLSRHSGEILWSEGEVERPRPFGSTLKPFLIAGADSEPPVLTPRPDEPEWRCVSPLPRAMDWRLALLRSCNGYFLDFGRRPSANGGKAGSGLFGPWGPVLEALGLGPAPRELPDAIGLRSTRTIAPLGLAHAYRLLAEARPDVLDVLSRNAVEGTLAGLPASKALAGVALKTGTVRDGGSAPRYGWIVGVDADRVVVMTRAGVQPRDFAQAFADVLARARSAHPGSEEARVQTFALVDPRRVQAQCPGVGVLLVPREVAREGIPAPSASAGRARVAPRGPRLLGPEAPPDATRLQAPALGALVRSGEAYCLGSPWKVRVPGAPLERDYAGSFAYDPAPAYEAPPGASLTEKQRRARRGSDIVFRTTRLLYAAGVLQSEDASLAGEPRAALARIVAHNATVLARHEGRPVCDTTHCQVFQGTVRPRAGDASAVAQPIPDARWMPFSAGGEAPWQASRPSEALERLFGGRVLRVEFAEGVAVALVARSQGGAIYEEAARFPCEAVRSALRLPSCPDTSVRTDQGFEFQGRGAGHGLGLDLSRARRGAASQQELVEEAREPHRAPPSSMPGVE